MNPIKQHLRRTIPTTPRPPAGPNLEPMESRILMSATFATAESPWQPHSDLPTETISLNYSKSSAAR